MTENNVELKAPKGKWRLVAVSVAGTEDGGLSRQEYRREGDYASRETGLTLRDIHNRKRARDRTLPIYELYDDIGHLVEDRETGAKRR